MTPSFFSASTVTEAVQALAAGARAVAGGTDLVVAARQGKEPLPDDLVAIHEITALHGIHVVDDRVALGALVTHAAIAADPLVCEQLTALADASAIVGSRATRAHGTIGGNLMNASPAMETGGPLLCFGTEATLESAAGTRTIPLDELLAGPRQTTARADELLTKVTLPLPPAGTGSAYIRLEYRLQMEVAVVGATAVVAFAGGVVTDARIAITALAPTVRRVSEAEVALVGSEGGRAAAEAAAAAAASAAEPIDDLRASTDYRRAMTSVITRRAVEAAVRRARGESVPVPASTWARGVE